MVFCSSLFQTCFQNAHLSLLVFLVTFSGVSECEAVRLQFLCEKLEKQQKNNLHPLLFRRGLLLARHPKQLIREQNISKKYPVIKKNNNNCVPDAGLCSSLRQPVDAFGGSARLSWSEPQSRSNLPKDPPSKTATLHKKDDTDTRIIFKSCGTACSLQHFQRLTANFLLSVCLCSATNFGFNRTQTHFMRIPK